MLTEKKFHNKQHTMTMLAFFNIKIETFHLFFLVLFKKSRNKKVFQIYAIYFGCYLFNARIWLFYSIIKLAAWVNEQHGNK